MFYLYFLADGGIKQYNNGRNLHTVREDSSYKSCDDSDFTDDLSKLTIDDEYEYEYDNEEVMTTNDGCTAFSRQSDFKSRAIGTTRGAHHSTSRQIRGGQIRGVTDMNLPYVLDLWKNSTPQNGIGVQVWMLSGFEKGTTNVRVSTDKNALIIETILPQTATDPKEAFNSYIIGDVKKRTQLDIQLYETVLELHPKVTARKNSIAKLRKRSSDKTKVIRFTQRITLPFKVRHQFSCSKSDPLFFGKKYVPYNDGSTWLHVEVLQDNQDAYVADEEDDDIDRSHLNCKGPVDVNVNNFHVDANDDDDDVSYDSKSLVRTGQGMDIDRNDTTSTGTATSTKFSFTSAKSQGTDEFNYLDAKSQESREETSAKRSARETASMPDLSPVDVFGINLPNVMTSKLSPHNGRSVVSALSTPKMRAPLVNYLVPTCGIQEMVTVPSGRSVDSGRSLHSAQQKADCRILTHEQVVEMALTNNNDGYKGRITRNRRAKVAKASTKGKRKCTTHD